MGLLVPSIRLASRASRASDEPLVRAFPADQTDDELCVAHRGVDSRFGGFDAPCTGAASPGMMKFTGKNLVANV